MYKTEYVVRFNQTILEEKCIPDPLKGRHTLVDYDNKNITIAIAKAAGKSLFLFFENYNSKHKPST